MDSWNDRQIAHMRAGGNAALIQFFTKHGIQGQSIEVKYNTPEAEWYRLHIKAMIDGGDVPTLEQVRTQYAATNQATDSVHGSDTSSAADAAAARLREKFGAGGLGSSSNAPMPARGSGGHGAGSGVDFDAAGERAKDAAVQAWGFLRGAVQSGAAAAAASARTLQQRAEEGQWKERMASSVQSAKSSEFSQRVSHQANTFWTSASASASAWWTSASDAVQKMREDMATPQPTAGSPDLPPARLHVDATPSAPSTAAPSAHTQDDWLLQHGRTPDMPASSDDMVTGAPDVSSASPLPAASAPAAATAAAPTGQPAASAPAAVHTGDATPGMAALDDDWLDNWDDADMPGDSSGQQQPAASAPPAAAAAATATGQAEDGWEAELDDLMAGADGTENA